MTNAKDEARDALRDAADHIHSAQEALRDYEKLMGKDDAAKALRSLLHGVSQQVQEIHNELAPVARY